MRLTVPRLVVAGLSGDSGKTLVALGIVRALARRGVRVARHRRFEAGACGAEQSARRTKP